MSKVVLYPFSPEWEAEQQALEHEAEEELVRWGGVNPFDLEGNERLEKPLGDAGPMTDDDFIRLPRLQGREL